MNDDVPPFDEEDSELKKFRLGDADEDDENGLTKVVVIRRPDDEGSASEDQSAA